MRIRGEQIRLTKRPGAALSAIARALVAALALLLAAQGVAHALSVGIDHTRGAEARQCVKAGAAADVAGETSRLPHPRHDCGACLIRDLAFALAAPDARLIAPAPSCVAAPPPPETVSGHRTGCRSEHGARAPPTLS